LVVGWNVLDKRIDRVVKKERRNKERKATEGRRPRLMHGVLCKNVERQKGFYSDRQTQTDRQTDRQTEVYDFFG
jgi:hypothetical protein